MFPIPADERVIKLNDEPGADQQLVLLAQRFGESDVAPFLGLVEFVLDDGGGRRDDLRRPERLREAVALERLLEIGDVAQRGLRVVFDRTDTDRNRRPLSGPWIPVVRRGLGVKLRELRSIAGRVHVGAGRAKLEPADPLVEIAAEREPAHLAVGGKRVRPVAGRHRWSPS
jgi:hypothetical protein